jgi:HEAT repeat protein
MFAALVVVSLLCPHGGQYLPPHPQPTIVRPPVDDAPVQPGYGPFLELQPDRWEWWFDFNREELVDRRRRMRLDPGASVDGGFSEVDDEVRLKAVLPVLLEALKHHNRDVRAAAALSVARLGLPSAFSAVVERTGDRDLFVRTQAILGLGFAHDAPTAELLSAILGEKSQGSEIRTAAAVSLGLLATPECIQILERYLRVGTMKHLDFLLQAGVVYAAGVAGEDAPVESLLLLEKSWQVKNDARLRSLLAVALGRSGSKPALKVVLRLLTDADSEVRRSAAAALEGLEAQVEEADAKRMLAQAAVENDLAALGNLYRALGRVRLPVTQAFLRRQLTRATTLIRSQVALALGLDGDPAHGDLLLEQLSDLHELSGRGALITALAMIRDPRVVPLLRDELQSASDPVYVGALCRAAGLMGVPDEDIVERLVELAQTVHDVEVARLALLGLGLLGQRAQVTALADSTVDVLATVDRAARIFALGQVGDRDTLPPLLALVGDERQPSYVIAYAVQALGEICDARSRSPAWRLSRYVNLYHDVPNIFELYRMF